MELKNRLFPAQEETEKVLSVIRKHWFSYSVFWLLPLLMLIPPLALFVYWINNPADISPVFVNLIIIFGSIYLLFILAIIIYGFVDFYLDVYIITDRRIVDISQNGFFKRQISEVNLRQVQDVNAGVDGFFATILHFGVVKIQTAAELPNFIFESIPHPYEVSKKIIDLHQTYLESLDKKEGSDERLEKITAIFKNETENLSEEECFSEETCNKKLLEGIKKTQSEQALNEKISIAEERAAVENNKKSEHQTEGELKEGKEVDL